MRKKGSKTDMNDKKQYKKELKYEVENKYRKTLNHKNLALFKTVTFQSQKNYIKA